VQNLQRQNSRKGAQAPTRGKLTRLRLFGLLQYIFDQPVFGQGKQELFGLTDGEDWSATGSFSLLDTIGTH
jgi:hypothetical protein